MTSDPRGILTHSPCVVTASFTLRPRAGPRATQALLGAARANAALALRDYVTPDDVKVMAPAVLEHRLILRPEFEVEGLTVEEAVKKILASVPVPT